MNPVSSRYVDGFLAALGTVPLRVPEATTPEVAVEPPRPDRVWPRAERVKRDLHPLDAFSHLLECARENRPPDAENRFRFEWFGLFYQGPRQDAFLLRLRLPGGRLRGYQLAELAEITQEFAGGQIALNSPGGIGIPGVPLPAAVHLLHRVKGIGLSAHQTGGDCVQAVRGGEQEGLRKDDPPIVYPLVAELEQALAHSRTLSNLPQRCEILFRMPGAGALPPQEDGSRIVLLQTATVPLPSPGALPEAANPPPFFLLTPGERSGGFPLAVAQVVPACLRLLEAWVEQGDRTDRQRAGLAEFCAGTDRKALGHLLGGLVWRQSPPLVNGTGQQTEQTPQGLTIPRGRLLSSQLACLAEVLHALSIEEVRLYDERLFFAQTGDHVAAIQALEEAIVSSSP